MKKTLARIGVMATIFVPSAHAIVTGAYSTGTNDSGGLLSYSAGAGTKDTHYALTWLSGVGAVVVNPNSYPAGNGVWLPDSTSTASQWIGPVADQYGFEAMGEYIYRLSVNVSAAADVLTGRWASDNTARISLNNVPTAYAIVNGDASDFKNWHPFSISGFALGANTLDFVVTNDAGVTGLRVEFDVSPVPVPEPATRAQWAAGALVLAGISMWRRQVRQPS